jgi:aryl-alcohol dehydrogenase-like predicted oxidoreductase
VREAFLRSLEKMRQSAVHALLVHHAMDLCKPGGELLADEMQQLKRQRLVSRIGVSVYDAAELQAATAVLVPEIVQLPLSVIDQRLHRDGTLGRLRAEGVEIHARSIFLQGLLLAATRDIRHPIAGHEAGLTRFESYSDSTGVPRLDLALGFVSQVAELDVALVGATCTAELEQIVAATHRPQTGHDWKSFACNDEVLLNPSRWRRLAMAPSNA